jgi:RimJ/RimL family protein N-acetyltransferase
VPGDELLTARLALRRPQSDDVDAILAVHSDPRTCAHNPSDALANHDEAAGLFAHWDGHWLRHGFGYFAVRRQGSAAVLGFCGLKFTTFQERRVLNLFYRLAPAAWGDGIAGEAATAVVGWAGERLPGQPVVARVRPENLASRRVAERAGLVRAVDLDEPGLDGFDLIYVTCW